MNQVWIEQLKNKLLQQYGSNKGKVLASKYGNAFPTSYQEECTVETAISDIVHLEKISSHIHLDLDFFRSANKPNELLHFKIFQFENPVPLSDVLPILENLDLRILSERPYKITRENKTVIWISDFSVTYGKNIDFNIDEVRGILAEALMYTQFGYTENDGFNKLILAAQLSWRDISILRAYAKYLKQISFRFSQAYIEQALVNNPMLTKDLLNLFKLMHDPRKKAADKRQLDALQESILQRLNAVASLDEDRIIRQLLQLIKATLRTNYFQETAGHKPKKYLSFKLSSKEIPELPLPVPLYEIFVYSPRFEGIHLRAAKVARGGIRWSDRREDFRTEILGLMKAQKVKNAVIVPSGAKGGFVLKALPAQADRAAIEAEVIDCYKLFIHGMLDITDNLKNGKVIKPPHVVCYDDDDTYLVVAADKGTATFSDIANSISEEYNFWLGDAFASGGSSGYDHKKMGITARGTWEAIKRHFRELNVNVAETDITVVGIGDMSGDVFGNGMIYSSRLKLVGAFDHRNVFIDPNPDPKISYKERLRLFNLPSSSWQDYNPKLISTGGGVYSRASKSIPISAEMKKALGIQENSLTPNELIRALLKAPVDLLYNGGIGTYVKASTESAADVGDKATELYRINGDELRCRVVGEGGNLGFTQLGRIEYALKGGLINTDFIDNSAGVNCSDHEVNIKIILNHAVSKGKISEKKRDQLLVQMTDEVAELVLRDNYNQALVMSFSALNSVRYTGLYQSYIRALEASGDINRVVEFLPDDKRLLERKSAGLGLTRPELAVLLAYTKIHIKNEILKSNLPQDPYLSQILETAFPQKLKKSFLKAMQEHPLRKEIIATQLSNQVVNEMGITFVYRAQVEMGATVAEIIRAYTVAASIFESAKLRDLIDSLNFKISVKIQYELLHHIRHLVSLATRWVLRNKSLKGNITNISEPFAKNARILQDVIPDLMVGSTKKYLESLAEQFIKAGLSKEMAFRIATARAMYIALNVIEISTKNDFDLVKTAGVYFAVGEHFNLVWFRDQIATDSREGHWINLSRLTLRDELDILQKRLTVVIMSRNQKEANAHKQVEQWMKHHRRAMLRWEAILEMLYDTSSIDYSMFFVALRELSDLIHASEVI